MSNTRSIGVAMSNSYQKYLSGNRKNMKNFFSNINDDLSLVSWSHAVNSRKKLSDALESSSMFLEADILLVESKHDEPIMAHPPQTDSDLKFSEWLKMSYSSGKGLKLDFKTKNALIPCLNTLNMYKNKVN